MYQKVRIMVVSLVVVALSVLCSTGTLAYFTDTDSSISSFTVGNAATTLAIYDDVSGDTLRVFDASRYILTDGLEVPFYLQATNDGNIPVYQRLRVVIPVGLENVIKLNLPTDDNCEIQVVAGHTCSDSNYNITYKPYDGITNHPAEYDIVSLEALSVGSVTDEWPVVAISVGDISNVSRDLFECAESDANRCVLGIYVYSDVIQAAGFSNALTAFENFAET